MTEQTPASEPAQDESSASGVLLQALQSGLATAQYDPAGRELYERLEAEARAQLARLEAAAAENGEAAAVLGIVTGRVFESPQLVCLIRGGVAAMVSAAIGNPRDWLTVCRSLKHIPAWVLESEAERRARVEAETEAKRWRGRPGQLARAQAGEKQLFEQGDADTALDGAAETAAAEQPAPQFASDFERREYLRSPGVWSDPIRKFGPLDRAMLERYCNARERRRQRLLVEEAMVHIRGGWVDLAEGIGKLRRVPFINPLTNRQMYSAEAYAQLERLEREGMPA